MAVHFNVERMAEVREKHDLWWKGKLDRPLVRLTLANAHPSEDIDIPMLSQRTCLDFSWTPEQVIEALDHALSRQEYLGDAFPWVNFDAFGPGVLAACCGARMDNSAGGVWFFPAEKKDIQDIHVKYDPESMIVKRIKAIYRAGLEKWNGAVMMSIPDLGGVLDVAASFRESADLLMDLYDYPEEVKRLTKEIQDAWYDAYNDLSAVLAPQNGYTSWCGLLSSTPSYITQCDFSYMISEPMFREFVLETLREDTKRLDNVMYHLDGIGELKHLDALLELEDLNAVQWVAGVGQPAEENWLDVYHKILAAGKQIMILGKPASYFKVLEDVHGTPYVSQTIDASETELAEKLLTAR